MKKQIFILFTMLFVGMATVFGQTITPRPIDGLVSGPLNPVAGVEYDYKVIVPTPPGDKVYQWFVTQNTNFLTARDDADFRELIDGDFLAAGDIGGDGFYTDNTTLTNEESNLSLTWKSFALDPAQYLFVVIYVTNTDPDGCISDNLKVYRIDPVHAFTLDIANMGLGSDYGAEIEVCPADVTSAVFIPAGAGGQVEFTYGENTLEYEVVAANFVGSYQLLVQFGGQHVAQDVLLEWSRTSDFASTTAITLTDGAGVVVIEAAGGPAAAVGEAGEVIYIRAVITHNNYEGLANRPFTLAIDGLTNGMAEVYYLDGNPDGFANDIARQTITARPTINPVDPLEFVPDDSQN